MTHVWEGAKQAIVCLWQETGGSRHSALKPEAATTPPPIRWLSPVSPGSRSMPRNQSQHRKVTPKYGNTSTLQVNSSTRNKPWKTEGDGWFLHPNFLGALAKLRKATIRFVKCVRLSVHRPICYRNVTSFRGNKYKAMEYTSLTFCIKYDACHSCESVGV